MPTLLDVARRAGVSPMTVSRVVNGSGTVSAQTRSRVELALAETGYLPNTLARGLRARRTDTIALVLPDMTNPFFTTLAQGVERTARDRGISLLLANSDEQEDEEARLLPMLLQRQVDGLLVVPAGTAATAIRLCAEQNVPLVLVDRRPDDVSVDTVRADSRGGARDLGRLLVGLGHRRLAVLSGPRTVATARERVEGFHSAVVEEAGLPGPRVIVGAYTIESGRAMTVAAMQDAPRPTALFAVNNFIAIGTLHALEELGLRVPEDVAVVSFDDLPGPMVTFPFLTVAAQPASEIGQRAVAMLLDRIVHPDRPPRDVVLPTEIVIRHSSGGPLVGRRLSRATQPGRADGRSGRPPDASKGGREMSDQETTVRAGMTSRERILSSVEHREPDRLAVDLGSTPSSGISAVAHANLVRHLALRDQRTRVYDVVQQLAQPSDELLDRLRIDVVDIGRTFNERDADWHPMLLANGTQVEVPAWFEPVRQPNGAFDAFTAEGLRIASMPLGAAFFDQTHFPYLDGYPEDLTGLPAAMPTVLWSGLVHNPWDHASEADFWGQLRSRTEALRTSTNRALMVVVGCNLFEWGTFLRRIDNFLMDLALDPVNVDRLLDALMEIHLATLEKVLVAVGDLVDVIRFGDDLGMDAGPLMSPDTYRRFFKPRHAQLQTYVHEHSTLKTFLHSCGSIHALLPDLIEAGVDIINPVQISARDMEPERLKREFGADITFWGGGADTRQVLPRGTPEDVKDHVRRNIETFAPGGGFVFVPAHNMLPDVPPENIVAMFEAVDEYR